MVCSNLLIWQYKRFGFLIILLNSSVYFLPWAVVWTWIYCFTFGLALKFFWLLHEFLCEITAVEMNVLDEVITKTAKRIVPTQNKLKNLSSSTKCHIYLNGKVSYCISNINSCEPSQLEENQAFCWLCRGDFGRLGHGNSSDVFTPQPIKALQGLRIKQIACGDSHCLAVTVEGEVLRFVIFSYLFMLMPCLSLIQWLLKVTKI